MPVRRRGSGGSLGRSQPVQQSPDGQFRSTPIGIGARDNRRSPPLMRNRDPRAPIVMDGYRSAGHPAIPTAGAGQGRGHPHARRAWCPSCMVQTNARRAGCPSCQRRVPCMGEFRSWPVVRGESRAWASPVHGPSSAMPRPNSACHRRRHRRCTNIYSFILPWRFIMARSAARLRRTVGLLLKLYFL